MNKVMQTGFIMHVQKVICSTTLQSADWHNITLLKDDIITQINELKQQDGEDIVILGSPRLAHYLMVHKLIAALNSQYHHLSLEAACPFSKTFHSH
ncbi:hypothetical protein [Macrococcoides canis]|uniref:Uncharacterized protein n=1 Tax=Macrococcoides canis TaxID=1855823 RepID=A0A6G5ZY68_9STAP|nr:hypothetical protein [Macrococcus canis]QHW12338.1 hypothetical protein 0076A_00051 [Macrococcus canis]DAC81093.1 TPA_inf: hypothetical protein [Macrococcus canis]